VQQNCASDGDEFPPLAAFAYRRKLVQDSEPDQLSRFAAASTIPMNNVPTHEKQQDFAQQRFHVQPP
jgi:hypothetical protein